MQINHLKLFITIFSAVFLSLTCFTILTAYTVNAALKEYYLAQLNHAVESLKSIPRPPLKPFTPPPITPQPTPEQLRQQRAADAAKANDKQLCDYWSAEYRKSQNDVHKTYRDSACFRYKNRP